MAQDLGGKLAMYRQACRKGTDWLLDFMNNDGSIGPVEEGIYYYRVPWAFTLMGEIEAASKVLDWINNNMLTSDGSFEGPSPRGAFDNRYGSYPIACLIVGAGMLQRFDIIRRGTSNLLSWQDTATGGFCNKSSNKTADVEQELFPTAQGGMAFLMAGQIPPARKAGEWFNNLWQMQPDPDNKLYAVCSPAAGLITEFDPDDAIVYVTRKDQPWEGHYNGGIAAAFLTNLYLATGEQVWLDTARQYQEFSMTTDECQFESMQVCKSSWGAGLLHVATREQCYRDWTVRLGDWYLEHQFEDGRWENTKTWTPNPTSADNIGITTEFVMHLANIITYLSV